METILYIKSLNCMVKFVISIALIMTLFQVRGQEIEKDKNSSNIHFEFFALPFGAYNQIELGISRKRDSWEHAVYSAAALEYAYAPSFSINLSYNLNYYFPQHKQLYLPLWFRVKNKRREVGYEEGYYPHLLRYSVGTGIGKTWRTDKKISLRTEIGTGISLNLTNAKGDIFPYQFNYTDYRIDTRYPEQNPAFIPTLRVKVDFILN